MTKHVAILFTERQYHCLKQLADNDFRTIHDLLRIYIYQGLEFSQLNKELYVEKIQEDRTTPNPETTEYYKDDEIIEFFKPVIKSVLEPTE